MFIWYQASNTSGCVPNQSFPDQNNVQNIHNNQKVDSSSQMTTANEANTRDPHPADDKEADKQPDIFVSSDPVKQYLPHEPDSDRYNPWLRSLVREDIHRV